MAKEKIPNARKRAGQALRHRDRNRATKHAVNTTRSQLLDAVAAGNKETAGKLYAAYSSSLDKAAKKGVLPIENASRKKARLAARIAKLA